jgi:hypothetical protein
VERGVGASDSDLRRQAIALGFQMNPRYSSRGRGLRQRPPPSGDRPGFPDEPPLQLERGYQVLIVPDGRWRPRRRAEALTITLYDAPVLRRPRGVSDWAMWHMFLAGASGRLVPLAALLKSTGVVYRSRRCCGPRSRARGRAGRVGPEGVAVGVVDDNVQLHRGVGVDGSVGARQTRLDSHHRRTTVAGGNDKANRWIRVGNEVDSLRQHKAQRTTEWR